MADRIVSYKLKIEAHEGNTKALAKIAGASKKAMENAGKARVRDETRTSATVGKIRNKELNEWRKARLSRAKGDEKASAKRIKDEERAAKAAARIAAKEAKDKQREAAKVARDAERLTKKRVADEKRALSQLDAARSRAQGRLAVGNAQAAEGFASGTESVARFARGFVALGIAGEKNTEKLLRGLVVMQGTFDVIVGSVNAYVRLNKMVAGFRIASAAANQLEAKGKIKNIALTKVEIATEAKLAKTRAASTAALGTKTAGGVAVGVGGAAAGSAAGGAATGGAGAFILGKLGGVAAKVGGIAARLSGLGVIAVVATEAIQGTRRALGDTSDSAESVIGALISWRRAAKAAAKSTEDLARLEKKTRAEMVGRRRDEARETIAVSAIIDRQAAKRQALLGRQATSPVGQLGQLDQGAALLQAQREQIGRTARGAEAEEARRKGLIAIADAERKIAQDRLTAHKELFAKRKEAADFSIDKAKEELEIVKTRVETAKQRLQSAAARFGQMSRADQRNLLRIGEKAKRDPESLTRAERAKLASAGTERAQRTAEAGDVAAAKEAGFFGTFGGGERRDIQQGERQRKALEIGIRDQRNIKIEVDRQEDRLAQQVADEVNRLLDEREDILAQNIIDRVTEERGELAGRTDSDFDVPLQRGQAIGGSR